MDLLSVPMGSLLECYIMNNQTLLNASRHRWVKVWPEVQIVNRNTVLALYVVTRTMEVDAHLL